MPRGSTRPARRSASYPKIRGTDELRNAIAAWIGRRYAMTGKIEATREVLPVSGSREALFFAAIPAAGRKRVAGRPAILIVNPFYQAYLGAALAGNCEPVFLNATSATGHLPDLDALARDSELLARTVAFYVCSPANPQGAVADAAYIKKALGLARRHDFMLFFDECYSEIYTREPPDRRAVRRAGDARALRQAGGLQLALQALQPARHALGLHGGRRRLPGNAGRDPQHGGAHHAGADPARLGGGLVRRGARGRHPRRLQRQVRCLRPAARRPLWLYKAGRRLLPVARYESSWQLDKAALTIWQAAGVRVIPGAYLAEPDRSGVNPGQSYVRVALVDDVAKVGEALERLVVVSA